MKRFLSVLLITGLAAVAAMPGNARAGSPYGGHHKSGVGIQIGVGSLHYLFRGRPYRDHRRQRVHGFRHYRHGHHRPHYRPYYRNHGFGHGTDYSGRSGQVIVVREPAVVVAPRERSENRTGCREYQTTVVINGREERAYGTACPNQDGSWERRN